jgi:hypothetical protein
MIIGVGILIGKGGNPTNGRENPTRKSDKSRGFWFWETDRNAASPKKIGS